MKIYNVNTYNIIQNPYVFTGDLKLVGNIIVEKNIIGAKEIVTNMPIKIVSDNTSLSSKVQPLIYEKYGCLLVVKKEDLTHENLASNEAIWQYGKEFLESDFLKFFREHNEYFMDQAVVDYKVKKILKKW